MVASESGDQSPQCFTQTRHETLALTPIHGHHMLSDRLQRIAWGQIISHMTGNLNVCDTLLTGLQAYGLPFEQ